MQAASICRLCMSHSDPPYNIFVENGSDGNVIAKLISDLLRLEVSECDVYPKIICYSCIQKLDEFKNFKDECMKSKCRFDEDILISKNSIDFPEEELVSAQQRVKLEESDVTEYLEMITVEPKLEPEESDVREDIKITKIKSESGAEEEIPANNFQHDIDSTEVNFQDPLKCESESVNMVFLTSNTMIPNEDDDEAFENKASNSLLQAERASFEEDCLLEDPLKLDEEYIPDNIKKGISSTSKSGPCRRRSYVCDNCGYKTIWKTNFICHIRIHTGEQPYKCNMCPKKFSRQSHLNAHLKVHLGDREFSCDICSKKFIRRADLTYHKKVHNKEWSLFCEFCGKGFMTSSQLQRHIVEHTGIKPFHCDQCSLSFTREDNLKRHMDTHSKNKQIFHCDKCGKSYSCLRYIKRHVCKV